MPERVCREVPKQLCQDVFTNPRTVKVRVEEEVVLNRVINAGEGSGEILH